MESKQANLEIVDTATGEMLERTDGALIVSGDSVTVITARKTMPWRSYVLVNVKEVQNALKYMPHKAWLVWMVLTLEVDYKCEVNETLANIATNAKLTKKTAREGLKYLADNDMVRLTRRSAGSAYTIHLNPALVYKGRGSGYRVAVEAYLEIQIS